MSQSRQPGRPLRILHLISSFQVGGLEHFAIRLAAEQCRAGHHAAVVGLAGGPLLEEAQRQGVIAAALSQPGRLSRAARGLRLLRRLRPDLLHAHNPSALHYAVLGRIVTGAPVVMTYHGRGRADARTPSPLERRLTSAVVGVSRAAGEQVWPGFPRSRCCAILNGIEPKPARRSREAVRAELGLGAETAALIAARVDGCKGHDTLLQASAILRGEGVPLTVLIAGDGAARGELQALSVRLGLQERVRFLGFRADVPDLLGAADFFVLPSLSEGLPLSVLEAMSHRVPVVATRVGGIPEVMEHGRHGLLVPVNQPEALAAALRRLCESPALREELGAASCEHVRSAFSFERMLREYDALYEQCLRRPAEPGLRRQEVPG
ncbi:MAG: glycosyltransferase family 4 protein [Armatimonadota bacterium]